VQHQIVENAVLAGQHQQVQEEGIAAKAANQTQNLPLSREEWIIHIKSGLEPAIKYVLSRFSEGGDRFHQV
jgi:hypothetical protein